MRSRAATFKPIERMTSGVGPMKTMPAAPTAFSTSTGSYAEVPVGLQPNGRTLASAVQGLGTPISGFNSPVLPGDLNHVVSTTIAGAAIQTPEPGTVVMVGLGLVLLGASTANRPRRRTPVNSI